MSSRLVVLACVVLALAAGCRDLVTPEGAMNGGFPAVDIVVQGLGSDGLLNDAEVTIDNSAWAPERPVEATATTEGGVARFEDVPPGLYDVTVLPYFVSSTPPWTETAVELGDSAAVVVYEGVPVSVEVDWPELDEIGPEVRNDRVRIFYALESNFAWGTGNQVLTRDESGVFRGFAPWAGSFVVRVSSGGPSFSLNYSYPDSVPLGTDSSFTVPSPLRSHPIELRFGDMPFTEDFVRVNQYDETRDSGLEYGQLGYTIDRSRHPDTVYLLDSTASRLVVASATERAFMDHTVWLPEGPALTGPINLGQNAVTLLITDESGAPVTSSTIQVSFNHRNGLWFMGDAARLDLQLKTGPHRFLVRAEGYVDALFFVDVDGGLERTVVLEEASE